MKFSTTIALFLVTAAVVAWVVYYERHLPTSAERAATAHLLATVDPLDVAEIKIEDGAGTVVRLRWEPFEESGGEGGESAHAPATRPRERPGRWMVTSPFKGRADQDFAEGLIDTVKRLEIVQTINGAHLVQGEDPFDASAREITLKRDKDTNLVQIAIGRTAAFQNSVYAKDLHGPPGVVCVAAAPGIAVLNRPAAQVRDPKLLPYSAAEIARLRLQGTSGELELVRTGQGDAAQWWLTKPLRTRADNAAVADLIAAVTASRVSVYAPQGNGGQETAAASASFDKATVTVTAWRGDQDEAANLRFVAPPTVPEAAVPAASAPPPPSALVKISGRSPVFSADAAVLTALDLMPNDLRADTLTALAPEAVRSVTVRGPACPDGLVLYRRHNGWWLYHTGNRLPANPDRVEGLMRTLNSSRVLEFTDDAASDLSQYGLDQPFREVSFSGAPVEEFDDGTVTLPGPPADGDVTLRLGQGVRSRVYANLSGSPFVYTIDPALVAEIPDEPVEWRSLLVASFSSVFDLRTITLSEGALPPLTLARDPESLAWSAARPGVDLTAEIDPVKVNLLAERLATFYADDWLSDRHGPLALLEENPALTVRIGLVRAPETGGAPVEEAITLRFAPTTPGASPQFYYGNREGTPEVFLLAGDHFRELGAPLLKDKPGQAQASPGR